MAIAQPESQPESLRAAAAGGARWTLASSMVMLAANIGQLVVVARLLGPREFGVATMAFTVTQLAALLADGGISTAIIVKKPTDPNQLSSLYWTTVAAGTVASLLVLAATPLVVAYYDQDRLATLLPLAAGTFVILATGQQYRALLERELQFHTTSKVEIVGYVVGAFVAIGCAASGVGAASLVLGTLVTATILALGFLRAGWRRWRPRRRFRRADLRGYLSFGAYQVGERTATYAGTNVDYFIVGGALGPAALGLYAAVFNMISLAQRRLNPVVMRVATPIFALKQEDPAALRRGYLEILRLIATITFPLMGGLAVVAPHLMPVLYGARYNAAIPVLQIQTLLGVMFALNNPAGSVFLAKRRPDIGFKYNTGRFVLLAVCLAAAVQYGLVWLAWAYVGVIAVLSLVMRVIVGRLLVLQWREFFAPLAKPTLCTAAMASAMMVAAQALAAFSAPHVVALVTEVAIGAVALILFFVLFDRQYATDILRLARSR